MGAGPLHLLDSGLSAQLEAVGHLVRYSNAGSLGGLAPHRDRGCI